LLDANALLILIRLGSATLQVKFSSILGSSSILDLTTYQIGNGIWKESELLKSLTPEETEKLASDLTLVLSGLERLSIEPSEFLAVLRIAKSEKKTFYDSSYIYVGKREKMTLVTEDQALAKAARKHIPTVSVRELISTRQSDE
jgi:predicted nucleic acid-binding protein